MSPESSSWSALVLNFFQDIISIGLIGLVTNGIAYKSGFFKRPSYNRPSIRWTHLCAVFGIYLGALFVLPIFLLRLLGNLSIHAVMTIQFSIVIATLLLLLLYIQTEKSGVMKIALKNPESSSSKWFDFGLGVVAWLIAFPWVGVVGQICDFVLEVFFNFHSYEQVAVRYLKDNLRSIPQATSALILIVLVAPIVEEILFRGTLQQYLKKFFSLKTSIAITAIIFACFHFSPMQGLGNFSLIPSLFVFSCFLGFVYERQGSIFASIGLHFTFNLLSSLQILFLS